MKYLVLGSAGQIGSALVPYLECSGHQVVSFDIVDSANEDLRRADNALLIEKVAQADFFGPAWDTCWNQRRSRLLKMLPAQQRRVVRAFVVGGQVRT